MWCGRKVRSRALTSFGASARVATLSWTMEVLDRSSTRTAIVDTPQEEEKTVQGRAGVRERGGEVLPRVLP